MVRPAGDTGSAVARMVELRGVQDGFPFYGTDRPRRRRSPTRTRCSKTTARSCGRNCSRSSGSPSAIASSSADSRSRSAASSRASLAGGVGAIQLRLAGARRLRRRAERPAFCWGSGSRARRYKILLVKAPDELSGADYAATRDIRDALRRATFREDFINARSYRSDRRSDRPRSRSRRRTT